MIGPDGYLGEGGPGPLSLSPPLPSWSQFPLPPPSPPRHSLYHGLPFPQLICVSFPRPVIDRCVNRAYVIKAWEKEAELHEQEATQIVRAIKPGSGRLEGPRVPGRSGSAKRPATSGRRCLTGLGLAP